MLEGLFGLLAFFGTILFFVIIVILIAIALLTRHPQRIKKIGRVVVIWIGVYLLVLLSFSLLSKPRFIEPGKERCYDEMCYSVTSVTTAQTLGTAPNLLAAKGEFYVITIQLRNDSKGTAQKPSRPDLFIIDARGKQISQIINAGDELGLPIGQQVTAAQLWDQRIPSGEIVTRTIAFDLPAGIKQPGLVVTEGVGPLSAVIIGDEGSLFHAKTEFPLVP